MIIDPRGLEWPIPPKGSLRWEDIDGELHLLGGITGLDRSRWYFPAENPTLFHRFASVELTKEGIIEIAEKFGALGAYYGSPSENEKMGDSFSDWKGELRRLKLAYDLWRALKKNDEDSLQSVYSEYSDVSLPRSQITITQELAWHDIGLEISFAFDRLVLGIQSKVSLKSEGAGVNLIFEPGSLIAFIWLQLAQVVTTSDRWKFCDFCGEPFKPESMKARYCSDSHRQMAYRKRKGAEK